MVRESRDDGGSMTHHTRPLSSVAIATRNYSRCLARALDSVFRCHNPTDVPIQVVVEIAGP
jgi:hypothetical protein